MKENSREEDIEILSRIRNDYQECKKNCKEFTSNVTTINREEYEALEHILSDYKRVLKMNEVLLKENEELKIKNNAIKRESEAYAENMIRLDNELNLEKEKSKYEWIRQNCLSQELVNKLYIPVQKVKDKIEEIKQEKKKYGNCLIEMYEDELVNRDIKILQELLESEEKIMEEKYINKILNFADENICSAKELIINKEQAKKIIKELQEDYTPNAIIKLKIAEYKQRKAKCDDIETEIRLDVKIRAYEELLEGRK